MWRGTCHTQQGIEWAASTGYAASGERGVGELWHGRFYLCGAMPACSALAVRDGDRLLDLVLQRRGLLPEVRLRGEHVTAAATIRLVASYAPIEEEATPPEQTRSRHIAWHAHRLAVL